VCQTLLGLAPGLSVPRYRILEPAIRVGYWRTVIIIGDIVNTGDGVIGTWRIWGHHTGCILREAHGKWLIPPLLLGEGWGERG
jgi:hypothetical protein